MIGKIEWQEGDSLPSAQITDAFDRGDRIYAEFVWPLNKRYCINIVKNSSSANWTEKNRSGKIERVKLTMAEDNIIVTGLWIEISWESEMTMNLSYKNA
jgi:hypothetical protein